MKNIGGVITTISASIVGLAALSVIFGSGNTSGVVQAFGNAYSSIIKAALGPVSGGATGVNGITGN